MKHIIGLVLSFIIFTIAFNNVSANEIPYNQISFSRLPDDYGVVGYYTIQRENLGETWEEWDSFEESFLFSFVPPKVCFGYFTKRNKAKFYSKRGYEWTECNDFGRTCLCLRKE